MVGYLRGGHVVGVSFDMRDDLEINLLIWSWTSNNSSNSSWNLSL